MHCNSILSTYSSYLEAFEVLSNDFLVSIEMQVHISDQLIFISNYIMLLSYSCEKIFMDILFKYNDEFSIF